MGTSIYLVSFPSSLHDDWTFDLYSTKCLLISCAGVKILINFDTKKRTEFLKGHSSPILVLSHLNVLVVINGQKEKVVSFAGEALYDHERWNILKMSLSCCCSSLFILPLQQKQFFVIISVSPPFPLLYKNIFFPCFTFDGNLMEICLQLFPFSIYSLKSASLLNMCDYTFITSFTVATLLCVSSLAICIRVLSLHIFLFKATLPKPLRFPLKRLDTPH